MWIKSYLYSTFIESINHKTENTDDVSVDLKLNDFVL